LAEKKAAQAQKDREEAKKNEVRVLNKIFFLFR